MTLHACHACKGSGTRKTKGWHVTCLCALPPTYRKVHEVVREAVTNAVRANEDAQIRALCEHDWMGRGSGLDKWRECFLCGQVEESDA